MRAINLLPPESFEKAKTRKRILQGVLIAVAYLALLGVLTFWWQGKVDRAEERVTTQQDVNTGLQAQVASLADARELVADYEANAGLVAVVLGGDLRHGVRATQIGALDGAPIRELVDACQLSRV